MTRPHSIPALERLAQDGERIIAEAIRDLRKAMASASFNVIEGGQNG